jgi:hypothetical protein
MTKTIAIEVSFETNSEDAEWIERRLVQLLSSSARISERTMGEAFYLAIAGVVVSPQKMETSP